MKKILQYQLLYLLPLLILSACGGTKKIASSDTKPSAVSEHTSTNHSKDTPPYNISRKDLIRFAKTFMGTPYKYGSINPQAGFDCSGFVYHVLQHFDVTPPRASYQYEDVGKEIKVKHAQPGDVILFTGPNGGSKIGHMGIITESDAEKPAFIHASSSKGVTISRLEGYYEKHFVKVIRILK